MKKVLLVINNDKLRDLYTLNMHTYLGCEVIEVNSFRESIDKIQKLSNSIDLIITEAKIGIFSVASLVFNFLDSAKIKIPIVVLGQDESLEEEVKIVNQDDNFREVVNCAGKELGISAKMMAEKVFPDYIPIQTKYLINIGTARCNIYDFNQDESSESKYVKKIKKGQNVNKKIINQLLKENSEIYYIESNDRLKFTQGYSDYMSQKIIDEKELIKTQMQYVDSSMDEVRSSVLSYGFTDGAVDLAKSSVNTLLHLATNTTHIFDLLNNLVKNDTSYSYKHSQLSVFICCYIIKNLSWGTREQQEMLSFVAFFHDINLDMDVMTTIKDQVDLDYSDLDSTLKDQVLNHASDAAELILKFPNAHPGIDNIIRQHHGVKNGKGFTTSYSSSISPLAIVFIIAEELTHQILKRQGTSLNSKEIVKDLLDKYPRVKYHEVIKTLSRLDFDIYI